MSKRSYSNPAGRNVFRLHDFENRPNHNFDLDNLKPAGYADISDEEKLSLAEFTVFLIERRRESNLEKRNNFYMRDHDNRPLSTQYEIPQDMPAQYASLTAEERFHIHEFIGFLKKCRNET